MLDSLKIIILLLGFNTDLDFAYKIDSIPWVDNPKQIIKHFANLYPVKEGISYDKGYYNVYFKAKAFNENCNIKFHFPINQLNKKVQPLSTVGVYFEDDIKKTKKEMFNRYNNIYKFILHAHGNPLKHEKWGYEKDGIHVTWLTQHSFIELYLEHIQEPGYPTEDWLVYLKIHPKWFLR